MSADEKAPKDCYFCQRLEPLTRRPAEPDATLSRKGEGGSLRSFSPRGRRTG